MTPTETVVLPATPSTGLVTALRRLEAAVARPVDIAWLAAYRVLFGLALAVSMERFLHYGWIDSLLVGPRFRFHYWGFAWVRPLSSGAMHVVFYALVGLALAIAAGLAFRITAPLFALGLTYVQLVDVSTYLNHYYLAGVLAWLLAFSPAHRAWSVDAWLARRRTGTIPAAWLVLFRIQVGLVYVFAGLAKAQPDWLLHGQPLAIWLGARTDVPVLGRLFTVPGAPVAMSWFGFLFDLTIVAWLSWRRTRLLAYAVVVVFHVLTRVLFDIGMFPIIMSLSALVFFDPAWPRLGPLRRSRDLAGPDEARTSAPRRWVLGVGAAWCLLQILLPLRCHLYGGNVLWHEQGMRFSWRVMVRAKGGAATFHVTDRRTGKTEDVSPRRYLTPFQENEMSSQPDLVLQLAHHIQRDFAARGHDVAVHADVLESLNGRRSAPLVDPAVDLTTVEDGLAPASFVLPSPSGPPPHTRPVR